MTMRTIYIAGPMTGKTEWNFPAFNAAAAKFRRAGWRVLNPAENFGGRTDLPWTRYLRTAIRQVTDSDAIALLPGWQASRGAMLEVQVAGALGLEFYDAVNGEKIT